MPIYKDLDILAYSMHGTSSERYPSWCPNWDLPRSRITLGGPIHTRGFAACDNEPPVAEFSDDSNTLWLKGFRVDDVQISDLQGTKSEFSWDRIRARLEANGTFNPLHKELLIRKDSPTGSTLVRSESYTNGLGEGKDLAKSQKISVMKALIATLAARDVPMADEGWFTRDRKPLAGPENIIQKAILVCDDSTGEYWPPDLEGFFEFLCHKTWGRTVILSSSGRLGLVPKDTEMGEEIFIIRGFRTLVILRKRTDVAYTWIGALIFTEL